VKLPNLKLILFSGTTEVDGKYIDAVVPADKTFQFLSSTTLQFDSYNHLNNVEEKNRILSPVQLCWEKLLFYSELQK